jgi:transposase
MVTVRRRSRLLASLREELVKYFVGGATARSAALLTGVNRHTATLFFRKLREVIAARSKVSQAKAFALRAHEH